MQDRRAADRATRRHGPARGSGEASRSTASAMPSVRSKSSRARRSSPEAGQVDVHVRGGGAAGRDGHQRSDLEVRRRVLVAAAGELLGERDDLQRGLDGPQGRERGRQGGLADRRGAGRPLLVGLARQLHRGAVAGECLGVLVGEGEEAVQPAPAPRGSPGRAARRAPRTWGGPRRGWRPSRPARRPGCRRSRRRRRHRGRARPRRALRRTGRPSGRGSGCSYPPADCRDARVRQAHGHRPGPPAAAPCGAASPSAC